MTFSPTADGRHGNAADYTDAELEALYRQAHQLHRSGMRAKAHDLFYFIAMCRPKSSRYCKALGVSLMSCGSYAAAIPVLATALLHDDGSDMALPVACAECLALTGRKTLSQDLFKQAAIALASTPAQPELLQLKEHVETWLTILKDS